MTYFHKYIKGDLIMNLTTKLQPVFIICAALIGLLLGGAISFGDFSVNLIEPFLIALLFMVFLSIDLKTIKDAFLNHSFTITSLLVNFVWTPIFAVYAGHGDFTAELDFTGNLASGIPLYLLW